MLFRSEMFGQMTQAHIDYMLSKIPMNRFVNVEELAAMIAWLSSEDCSFSTGAVFDISGGRFIETRCESWPASRSSRRLAQPAFAKASASQSSLASRAKTGGRCRDRTCDPLHVKEVLFR